MADRRYPPVDLEIARSLGLDEFDWERVVKRLGRAPNKFECHVIAQIWSEDYANKSSSAFLDTVVRMDKRLRPVRGSKITLIDIGGGYHLALRMCHANPEAVLEPSSAASCAYAEALGEVTALGGIPLVAASVFRCGSAELTRTHAECREIQDSLANFSNLSGIPLLSNDIAFHPSYNKAPLANIGIVGLVHTMNLPPTVGTAPAPAGGALMYIGYNTGREALPFTMRPDWKPKDEEPIPPPIPRRSDPYYSGKIIQAIEAAFEEQLITGAAALGIGGLATGGFAVSANIGRPVRVDLDRVPREYDDMTPEEILLSETPGRFLAVVPKNNQRALSDLFYRWNIPSCTIGESLEADGVQYWSNHHTIADVPLRFGLQAAQRTFQLVKFPPMLKRAATEDDSGGELRQKPKKLVRQGKDDWDKLKEATSNGIGGSAATGALHSIEDAWLDLLGSANRSSRTLWMKSFDSLLNARKAFMPMSDAAIVRFPNFNPNERRGLAYGALSQPLYVSVDPYLGTVQTIATLMRRLCSTGAEPVGVAHCLNYGDPERYREMCDLSESIRALSDACEQWSLPISADCVSLKNQSEGSAVLPTPSILMAGILPEMEKALGSCFVNSGDVVLIIGDTKREIDVSDFSYHVRRSVEGKVPEIDFPMEFMRAEFIRTIANQGLLQSCHTVGSGGLAIAFAEATLARGRPIGASLELPVDGIHSNLNDEAWLFSETSGRYLVSCKPSDEAEIRKRCDAANIPIQGTGKVGGKLLVFSGAADCEVPVATAYKLWFAGMRHILGLTPEEAGPLQGFAVHV